MMTSVLLFGLLMGMRHTFEADHIAARTVAVDTSISGIDCRGGNPRSEFGNLEVSFLRVD